jgi:hypothetical protein
MATALKPKAYPGSFSLRPQLKQTASSRRCGGRNSALTAQLHDLRSEFIVRENQLRDEYLAEVAEITAANGA